MNADKDMQLFILNTKNRMLNHYLPQFKICLDTVSDEQLWREEADSGSIGGIVIHVMEHVRRNVIRLIDPEQPYEDNSEPFFQKSYGQDKKVLTDQLDFLFMQLKMELEQFRHQQVCIHNLNRLVEHTGDQLGQLVMLTERSTGSRFQFGVAELNEQELRTRMEGESAP